MQEQDEPNLEASRYMRLALLFTRRKAELNAVGWPREVLEGTYGEVWSTDELRAEFEVQGFFAPLVVVKSRADGGLGTLEFQHNPRFYFNFVRDQLE